MAQHEIPSPLPGVFYRRPSPDTDLYVEEGQQVNPDDTICLVEIMKQFHEIKAGVSGTLVKFLVENEGSVDAGQTLAIVETG